LSALRRLLELSDAELVALCEVISGEVGAWVGVAEPVPPEYLADAVAPLAVMVAPDGPPD
jgi:hypothetical protein